MHGIAFSLSNLHTYTDARSILFAGYVHDNFRQVAEHISIVFSFLHLLRTHFNHFSNIILRKIFLNLNLFCDYFFPS